MKFSDNNWLESLNSSKFKEQLIELIKGCPQKIGIAILLGIVPFALISKEKSCHVSTDNSKRLDDCNHEHANITWITTTYRRCHCQQTSRWACCNDLGFFKVKYILKNGI